jgi:prolyl 4-hydroxylase
MIAKKIVWVIGLVLVVVVIVVVAVGVIVKSRRPVATKTPQRHVLKIDETVRNSLGESVSVHRVSGDETQLDETVYRVDNLLTPSECAHLIEIAQSRLKRSTVQGDEHVKSGEARAISKDRTSSTANLKRHEDHIVSEIEKRACALVGVPIENMETLQVVRYEPGQLYKPHFDYFPRDKKSSEAALRRGGQRTVTVFAYLNTPDDAETCPTRFPNLGDLRVTPKLGSAAVWHNLRENGDENPKMLHGGDAPRSGTKYGCNVFFRQSSFI